jgi:hypothetical protein
MVLVCFWLFFFIFFCVYNPECKFRFFFLTILYLQTQTVNFYKSQLCYIYIYFSLVFLITIWFVLRFHSRKKNSPTMLSNRIHFSHYSNYYYFAVVVVAVVVGH